MNKKSIFRFIKENPNFKHESYSAYLLTKWVSVEDRKGSKRDLTVMSGTESISICPGGAAVTGSSSWSPGRHFTFITVYSPFTSLGSLLTREVRTKV